MMDKLLEPFMKFGDAIIQGIDVYSFEVCLLVGMVALVLYIFGCEKGKKIATISPVVYLIIQIFLKGWFGV